MRLITRARWSAPIAVLSALFLSVGLFASPASALNRVTCGSRTDWLRIYNYGYSGELCFANNGYQNVAIYDVNYVNFGNNSGYYYDTVFGWWQVGSYGSVDYGSAAHTGVEITYLEVDGR